MVSPLSVRFDWLNENTGEDTHFFGIELQVVRIGDSVRAPLFNVVVQPNDWQKQVRAATQSSAPSARGTLYLQFLAHLFVRLKVEHPDWRRWMTPRPQNWADLTSPIKDTWFSFAFGQADRLKSEFNIDAGDEQRNPEILALFQSRRAEIEEAYGRALAWEDLPNARSCRIADYKEDCNVAESARWDEFTDWFFDSGARFRKALPELIASVPEIELKAGATVGS